MFKKDIKPIWCPGCGLYAMSTIIDKVMTELGWNKKNTVVLSGIGCTGRTAGYLDFDSVNTTHGRVIPVAEGIKIHNPKLNVVIISGDGDLLSIGGNHLLHTARRNTNLKIICNINEVYGMTGGQIAPTAPRGAKTLTTPTGSEIEPINAQGIIMSNKNYFFGRASVADLGQMKEIIKQSFKWDGFSFVEIHSPCLTNYALKNGFKNPVEINEMLKNKFKTQEKENILKNDELGITKN